MFKAPRYLPLAPILGMVASCLAMTLRANGQDQPYTLHVKENEVVADLFAVKHSDYLPDRTLTRLDVVVTDDGEPVALTSFATSTQGPLRPLAVWLVAQCDLKSWASSGSRFLHGRASTLAAGLSHLRPEDTVAAAGWCDDGQQEVGVSGHELGAVVQDLERWTTQQKASLKTTKRKAN